MEVVGGVEGKVEGVVEGEEAKEPIAIGHIALTAPSPLAVHHRDTPIALGIAATYRGKGYGREAIEWALDYAFAMLGMHRVSIGYSAWNEGAGRLYARMGFVEEERRRQARWFRGRWWDSVGLGMLEEEWRERRKKEGRGFDEGGMLLLE